MNIKDLKSEYMLTHDSYDAWGSAMGVYFDLCSELYHRDADIPASWDYHPGAASDPREPEGYWFDMLIDADTDTLLHFGRILHRYTSMLDTRGDSY